jgi:hypothetical protein
LYRLGSDELPRRKRLPILPGGRFLFPGQRQTSRPWRRGSAGSPAYPKIKQMAQKQGAGIYFDQGFTALFS